MPKASGKRTVKRHMPLKRRVGNRKLHRKTAGREHAKRIKKRKATGGGFLKKRHSKTSRSLRGRGLVFLKKEIEHKRQKKVREQKKHRSFLRKLKIHKNKTKHAKFGKKFFVREPVKLIVVRKPKDLTKTDVKYPLLEPFAYAHIKWSESDSKLKYAVLEPELSSQEKGILKKIEDYIEEIIDVKLSAVENRNELVSYLQKIINQAITILDIRMGQDSYSKIMYHVYRNFVVLNEMEPLLHDPYIEDIGCVGSKIDIYIVHKIFGSLETNIRFDNEEYLENLVVKLAERCGRYVSYAQPMFDGSLPDGSRVQATMAKDVTTRGASFSIRKFRKNPFSPVDLINLKTASPELMAYLWLLIQYSRNIMVCGGVATGKTTFLNSVCMFVPEERKIVSIEDTREINIVHENWIPAVTRTGFGIPEITGLKYGEVELFDLLKESFRQKPDYIIVWEVRGKEAYVLFQGMASGNPSLGTMHAGNVDDVIKRLETPPIELSPNLIETLDAIIIMSSAKERGESARRVKEIEEIVSIDRKTGKAKTAKVFEWNPRKDSFRSNIKSSVVLKKISYERGLSVKKLLGEIKSMVKILESMQKGNIVHFEDVCKRINDYYKKPSGNRL